MIVPVVVVAVLVERTVTSSAVDDTVSVVVSVMDSVSVIVLVASSTCVVVVVTRFVAWGLVLVEVRKLVLVTVTAGLLRVTLTVLMDVGLMTVFACAPKQLHAAE